MSVVSRAASHCHLIPRTAGQVVGASIDLVLYEEFKVSNASRLGGDRTLANCAPT